MFAKGQKATLDQTWVCSYSPRKPRNPADEGAGGTLRATQPRKQSDLVEEDLSPEISFRHVGLSKWERSVRKKLARLLPTISSSEIVGTEIISRDLSWISLYMEM